MELGELTQLRVLSMGNNSLCGDLPERYAIAHMRVCARARICVFVCVVVLLSVVGCSIRLFSVSGTCAICNALSFTKID